MGSWLDRMRPIIAFTITLFFCWGVAFQAILYV